MEFITKFLSTGTFAGLIGKLLALWRLWLSVNWTKTIYFNFKMFPAAVARKLPIFFYGKVTFGSLSGTVKIDALLRPGMVGFGQPYEVFKTSGGTAQFELRGNLIFRGNVQFGPDYLLWIGDNGVLDMGHMSSLGRLGKIICYNKITFSEYSRVGFESQFIDHSFHRMIDLKSGDILPYSGEILLGPKNYVGNRVSMMQGAVTPARSTIASNSLCNKDFSSSPEASLFAGTPAKVVRSDLVRDWEGEDLGGLILFKNFYDGGA